MSTYSRLIESVEWHFIRLADTGKVEPTPEKIERYCDGVASGYRCCIAIGLKGMSASTFKAA